MVPTFEFAQLTYINIRPRPKTGALCLLLHYPGAGSAGRAAARRHTGLTPGAIGECSQRQHPRREEHVPGALVRKTLKQDRHRF